MVNSGATFWYGNLARPGLDQLLRLGSANLPASQYCRTLSPSPAAYNNYPKALPIQIGERFVPGGVIAGAHYVVWGLPSLAILFAAAVFLARL